MAVSLSVLVMQAQHAIELVRQLEMDIAASPRVRASAHLEIAEHLTLAAAVLLERAVGHLRCAVHETSVAPCVLTAADRAAANRAEEREASAREVQR
jgi:hypothetical protein